MNRLWLGILLLVVGCGAGTLGALFSGGGGGGGGGGNNGSGGSTSTPGVVSGVNDDSGPIRFFGDVQTAFAQTSPPCGGNIPNVTRIFRDFDPPSPPPAGQPIPDGDAWIDLDPNGPERFRCFVSGLEGGVVYSVFLTASDTLGALPAVLVASFITDLGGFGMFELEMELQHAYIAVPDQTGIGCTVDVFAAGAVANLPERISLNSIRIYRGVTAPGLNAVESVFAACDSELPVDDPDAVNGGGNVLTLDMDLP